MEKKQLTKKELLKMPQREWDSTDRKYDRVWLIPSGTKHDSGYMHIAIMGVWKENEEEKYEICGYPDDISTFFPSMRLGTAGEYAQVRMDCFYPNGVLQYHGRNGKFHVSESLSSMDIKFIPE